MKIKQKIFLNPYEKMITVESIPILKKVAPIMKQLGE